MNCKYPILQTCLVFFVLSVHLASAQDARELIVQMGKTYAEAERLEYTCTYELFKGHSGEELHTRYTGYLYREGDLQYQKMGPGEYVYGNGFFLQIGHEEKELVLSGAQKPAKTDIDPQKILDGCKVSSVKEKGTDYVIELQFPASAAQLSSVVLRIGRSDHTLKQMDLFYSVVQDFSPTAGSPEMALPHLRMTFTDISLKARRRPELVNIGTYLRESKGTFTGQAPYETYAIKDNR